MAKTIVLALVLLGVVCAQAVEIRVTPILEEQKLLRPLGSPLLTRSNRDCSSDGIFAIPGDCTAYIICRKGRERRRQCPAGFRFDSIMHCTPDDTADCGLTPLKQALEKKLCPRNYGIFPYANDCHKYVVCHEGRARVRTCPKDTVYRRNVGCVDGDVCPTSDRSEAEKSEGDCSTDGIFAIPGDCTAYIICFNGREYRRQCPANFFFDSVMYCTPDDTADCGLSPLKQALERTPADREVCELDSDTGPCYGHFPKYYYDSESKTCKSFIYGGCEGNDNKFETENECRETCVRETETSDESICDLPVRTGSCHGYLPRYYYDSKSRDCKQFIYGGCRGNDNNFITLDECRNKCVREIETEEHDYKEFQCKRSGRFANPNSCDSYIECSVKPGSVDLELVQCPRDQHYNIETKECDDKCNAQCDQELACTCGWPHCLITCERPNGLFPVPTNCRLYFQCKNSIPRILRCPEGKAFDPELKECVNIEDTNCANDVNDIWSVFKS